MLDIIKNKDISVLEEGSIDLFIESWSNAAQTVQIRGVAENSQIIADHTTNSDRSLATSVVPVTGIPVSLTLRTAATGVDRGQCYVKVSLRVEGVVVALLMAGYVTDTGTQAYPNGVIESSIEGPGTVRLITGTDPAAGVDFSETVPTGARWRLLALRVLNVTDATVLNRSVAITYSDGTIIFGATQSPNSQPASVTYNYNYMLSGADRALVTTATIPIRLPMIYLLAGYKVASVVSGIQAGDNLSAPILLVEEWIEP